MWRAGSALADGATVAVLDAALAAMRRHGVELIDPVEVADFEKLAEPEFAALTHEFKHDINAYLAGLGGDHPGDLAGLIDFNNRNAAEVLAHFGQELFEAAQATSGSLDDPDYAEARSAATQIARGGLDSVLTEHRLDAVMALTGHPAWLTDHVLGDYHGWGTSGLAAVSGYPSVAVPAGLVNGLPVGISLTGPPWSEARLIALAHAFELARAPARGPDDASGSDNLARMDSWPAPYVPELPGSGPQPMIWDTASGSLTAAAPGGTATLYACGITPYDATHIGHAATFLAWDLLIRAWRDAGKQVSYVQNVTDVDDPLLERADRDGEDWRSLADREIALFRSDMTALRVLPPDRYIGAVEAIPLIEDFSRLLADRGSLYEIDGDVYFSRAADPAFGSVSGLDARP